ncbi:MAG: HAD-superfamily hydrolase, subfamily IA, variant 3 [Candidatus Saccharibacteria bacterium GW2011_GWA2_46_10]|nr:MAG: HAD-superfamily hydrolase, subfamily IA, variant 3 [Candidatus Saccharibacteria bacterium GW2011_GWA2_46_10]OGL35505.1 MAG: hypothetical protein A3F05_00060 [Candidatus Saccharibacteria bacterium RIFCSPHIGHO2_12_FULL_47_17]
MVVSSKIKAAVFDVDGMLLDTRELVFRTYEHTLTSHGYPAPPKDAVSAVIGMQVHESYLILVPEADVELIVETHRTFQNENLHLVIPYEGLEKMLAKLHAAGIKMAVFTSRGPGAREILKDAGVLRFFETVITADDVVKHKPDPEGLFEALKGLKVDAENAAMLGDAPYDIQAGKVAEVGLTIGITHGFGTREDLEKTKPDFIVDSLAEIPAILLGKMVGNDPD